MEHDDIRVLAKPRAPFSDSLSGFSITLSATAFVIAIPSWMFGHTIRLKPRGASCAVRFGSTTTVTVDYTQAASVDGTTRVVTLGDSFGEVIVDGTSQRYYLDKKSTASAAYMGVDASAAGVMSITLDD